MQKLALLGLGVAVVTGLVGCGSEREDGDVNGTANRASGAGTATSPAPVGTVQDAHAAFRSGMVQLEGMLAILDEAQVEWGQVNPQIQDEVLLEGMADIADFMESASDLLNDAQVPVPDAAEFERDFARWDEARLNAIDRSSEALTELISANNIAADLVEVEPAVGTLSRLLQLCIDSLSDTIFTLGGDPGVEPLDDGIDMTEP